MRMKQKEVFPCVGGGFKMVTQSILPPPPPRGGFSPKTCGIGHSRLLPCDVAGHVTCAELWSKSPFSANSSTDGFSKKPL